MELVQQFDGLFYGILSVLAVMLLLCLIYAMISFLAVVVLTRIYTGVYREAKAREEKKGADNHGNP